LVEKPESGPTERANAPVFRVLCPKDEETFGGFGWGYNGGGTSRAAAAVLADALDLGDPDACGMTMLAYPRNDTLVELREDFCVDVLAQFPAEWRIHRRAVLRWARGWYAEHNIAAVPEAIL
jgi:hypothetical protein